MGIGIVDKILGALLALAILAAAGAMWYGDHEHAKLQPLQDKIQQQQHATLQAQAARDAALQAAEQTRIQLAAAEDAASSAQASAAAAASDAFAARARLAQLSHAPATQKQLETPIAPEVWRAIYNAGN